MQSFSPSEQGLTDTIQDDFSSSREPLSQKPLTGPQGVESYTRTPAFSPDSLNTHPAPEALNPTCVATSTLKPPGGMPTERYLLAWDEGSGFLAIDLKGKGREILPESLTRVDMRQLVCYLDTT